MADFNIQRLKYTWRGSWNPGVEFKKDDIAYYAGKSYSALSAHTSSANFVNDLLASQVDTTYTITVSTDTFNLQAQGHFYVDGVESPFLTLLRGRKYIFNQDADSNVDYNGQVNIFLLSTIENGTLSGGGPYLEGTTFYLDNEEKTYTEYVAEFATATERRFEIIIPPIAPNALYYYSYNNIDLGAKCNSKYTSYWELVFNGRVWRGDWADAQYYPAGSIVKLNGKVYECLTTHLSTTTIDENINFWTYIISGYSWQGNWQADTYYNIGDVVKTTSNTYYCIQAHESEAELSALEVLTEKWLLISIGNLWMQDWARERYYNQNDIVRYGGNIYKCIESHTSTSNDDEGIFAAGLWELLVSGFVYIGDYPVDPTLLKVNDVVKYGGTLFQCIEEHFAYPGMIDEKFQIFVPGLEFENLWSEELIYNKGDIVLYGGYSYTALENNFQAIPSDSSSWELLLKGYNFVGEFSSFVGDSFYTGDVVSHAGSLYLAISDTNTENAPGANNSFWQILVPGENFKAEWEQNVTYYPNNLVNYAGTLYKALREHRSDESDSRPDLDKDLTSIAYWEVFIQGSPNNVLSTFGDIKTYTNQIEKLAIGELGSVLNKNSENNVVQYTKYDYVPNIFYVSMDGVDSVTHGVTPTAPFATVKYACDYILANVDTTANNTTIFVKSGFYQEILPISVPANCAIVGDELRSTSIQPATGYELSNMFYVRNGSGIRNLSLQGLNGTLGEQNEFLTKRPTAGAYVSLDPGAGTEDESVWITSKSPYIQNVSTFGNGCIGMKIDGALHDGGNDSIVANDFTQILSDGIGYWADNLGRSELVSVFTYYCHIGYLCTNGGILRATNGNNSYGEYGSVAEGFDANETPVTADIDNRTNEAQFGEAITFGTTQQTVIAIAYSHAGQDYTNAAISFGGAGFGAVGYYDEFRYNAISNLRIISADMSTLPGGANYTERENTAVTGTATNIRLSNAETITTDEIVGQRIIIKAGLGVGQYAKVTAYDEGTFIADVVKETTGVAGWDHFQPGWPIESALNDTTRYVIEPCVSVSDPARVLSSLTPPGGFTWSFIEFCNGKWLAMTDGSSTLNSAITENDGVNWSVTSNIGGYVISNIAGTMTSWYAAVNSYGGNQSNILLKYTESNGWQEIVLPATDTWNDVTTDKDQKIWVLGTAGNVAYSADDGANWTLFSLGSNGWTCIKYSRLILVATKIAPSPEIQFSVDSGLSWSISTTAFPLTTDIEDITYGNNRFVAVGVSEACYSFDGDTWYNTTLPVVGKRVAYGNGIFITCGIDGSNNDTYALSKDGKDWFTSDTAGTFALFQQSSWTDCSYGNGFFLVTNSSANTWNKIATGAKAVIRPQIAGGVIQQLVLYDVGGGYNSAPIVDVIDNANTTDADLQVFVRSGVLSQPEMFSRGQGYTTITAEITGDGFAEIYQNGRQIKITNLSKIPSPGANLDFLALPGEKYSLSRINSLSGNGPYDAEIEIAPSIDITESIEHLSKLEIREKYSQIRLTGHDFLDIGTGNFNNTDYPDLYLVGETTLNARQPFNETVASGGGRVFYTSTDQDGNFRVGELFKVEQSTGVVTISASQFDLGGLTEINLGGIQIGGTAVIIREFSKDKLLAANSNNIVPTQAAIKAYIESRVSGGGANATTNELVAAQVVISENNITTRTETAINYEVKDNILAGIDGHYLATMLQD
tara:strand:+ start:332 stop:5413 length:5082 start_codon:yes stop_codon:yes gene_type:complete